MLKQQLENNYLVSSYPNRWVIFDRGEGVYLIDSKNERYLDLGSNYGVSIFGYNHKAITEALDKQLHKLINLHGSFNSDVRNQAAKGLIQSCGGKVTKVFFSNSGAEAIEGALKFARLATGKSHFIAMEKSYHGKTLGALSATSGDKYRKPFTPLLWNFTHVPFGNIKRLRLQVSTKTAAVIIEPIQGEGGIIIPPKNYLQSVQKVCRENNVLLIVDEIQTGAGRTGTFLASHQFGLEPDIVCLGKGLAGGIPIGATLVSGKIANNIPLQIHTSTFGGNPLACRGIIAVLKQLDNDRLKFINNMGSYFLDQLKKIKHPSIVSIRGIGLMLAIELNQNATPVLKALQREHIITIPAGSNVIRFLPPYTISKKEIDKAISVLTAIFTKI